MNKFSKIILMLTTLFASSLLAQDKMVEIICTIKDPGASLLCVWSGKEKTAFTSDDIPVFIDQAYTKVYITVKSRRGHERTFTLDSTSTQFKRLTDIKKSGSASDVSKAKQDLFSDVEKMIVRLSDDLDAKSLSAELVKYDASVTTERYKKELSETSRELEAFLAGKNQLCVATPHYENINKLNMSLQVALSNVLVAFQTQGTCMESFKVKKDGNGLVDLSQLDGLSQSYKDNCIRK